VDILVLKTGHSETLEFEEGGRASLGDVLRTTPILHALRSRYPESRITWVTAPEARPLIEGAEWVDQVVSWAPDGLEENVLPARRFDVVVNLEKHPSLCTYAESAGAGSVYGFRRDAGRILAAHPGSQRLVDYLQQKALGARAREPWQRVLIEMLGEPWLEQPYVLGYAPRSEETCDVGLNHAVGPKWATKAMPRQAWEKIADQLCSAGLEVSWQRGFHDLRQYIDWLQSCRVVVSSDSLGLHAAIALGKRLIGIFGPTDPAEVHGYGRAVFIETLRTCRRAPCRAVACAVGEPCMEDVPLNEVAAAAAAAAGLH